MISLCSFLWSCSAPSYGIAFGKSRVWFAVLFKYFKKSYLMNKYIFHETCAYFIQIYINIHIQIHRYTYKYIQKCRQGPGPWPRALGPGGIFECIYMYICVFIHVYVCIFVYLYVYLCIFVYLYFYFPVFSYILGEYGVYMVCMMRYLLICMEYIK